MKRGLYANRPNLTIGFHAFLWQGSLCFEILKMTYDNEQLNALLQVASEELRQRLNEVIANHQMSGEAVLAMLARITAGYIHQMQRAYDHAGADEVVEESFQTMLTAFLTDFDMSDVRQEIDKIKREQVN